MLLISQSQQMRLSWVPPLHQWQIMHYRFKITLQHQKHGRNQSLGSEPGMLQDQLNSKLYCQQSDEATSSQPLTEMLEVMKL